MTYTLNAKQIREAIQLCKGLVGFEYNGKDGNVDPYYLHESKSYEYLLFFNGNEQTVYNMDDVMNTPFIDGHTLNEVADQLVITEY